MRRAPWQATFPVENNIHALQIPAAYSGIMMEMFLFSANFLFLWQKLLKQSALYFV